MPTPHRGRVLTANRYLFPHRTISVAARQVSVRSAVRSLAESAGARVARHGVRARHRDDDAASTANTTGQRARYLLPLMPGRAPKPHAETLRWSTLTPRAGTGSGGAGTLPRKSGDGSATVPVPPPVKVEIPDPGDGGRVYIESEMGRPVKRDPSSAAPAYPDFLQREGIEGTVAVEYIVDTTGLADSASLRIIRTTNPAFAESVRAALPGMRFEPGQVAGRLVRQLVTQEFRFVITQTQPAQPAPTGKRKGHSSD
jgi:TonB family protein